VSARSVCSAASATPDVQRFGVCSIHECAADLLKRCDEATTYALLDFCRKQRDGDAAEREAGSTPRVAAKLREVASAAMKAIETYLVLLGVTFGLIVVDCGDQRTRVTNRQHAAAEREE
jgi:hypothetical protein